MDKHNLHFTEQAWLKIQAAVLFDKTREVAFFGHMTRDEDGPEGETYHMVDDILIPPQEVGGAHAEFDVQSGDMNWLLMEIIKRGQQPSEWRFWGHSHASMSTTPSAQDHTTLGLLASKAWPNAGYGIGAVFNVRQEVTAWYATRTMYGGSTYADGEIKGVTYEPLLNPYMDEIGAQIKAVIREPVRVPTATSTGAGTGTSTSNRPQVQLFGRQDLEEALAYYKNGSALALDIKSAYDTFHKFGISALCAEDIGAMWTYFDDKRKAIEDMTLEEAVRDTKLKELKGEEQDFAFALWEATAYTKDFIEKNTKLLACAGCGYLNTEHEMLCGGCYQDLAVTA